MGELSVLWIGDCNWPEFCAAYSSLCAASRVTTAATVDEAWHNFDDADPPDLFVVAQPWSGCHATRRLEALRRRAPLARVIALVGSWCEGELRSGEPLPGAYRVVWHQWEPRIGRDLERWAERRCPAWGLPVTATDDDRLLAAADESPSAANGLVVIVSPTHDMSDLLSGACRARGLATVQLRPGCVETIAGATAAVWDAGPGEGSFDDLARTAAALKDAPLVALLSFPRLEHRKAAIAAGATAVLATPLLLDELFWHLVRPLGQPGTGAAFQPV